MPTIINQGWIAESPEALRAKRDADKMFEESGKKYDDDPSLAWKEQASIRESLGYGKFSAGTSESWNLENKEEAENPDDILTALDDVDDMPVEAVSGEIIDTWEEIVEAEEKLATNLELHQEHPAYPMFDNFNITERQFNQPEVTEDVFVQVTEWIWEEGWLDLKKLENNVKEAKIDDKDLQRNLINYIRKTMALNPKRQLETDWETRELPEEFKQNTLLDNPESDINQLIAANYIRFPQWAEGNPSFEQDIHTSCKTAANCIIAGKDIPRNEGFEIAMNEIQSTDLATQLNGLKYLHKIANTNEGQHGKRQQEKGKKLSDARIANNNAADAFQTAQQDAATREADLHAKNTKIEDMAALNIEPEVKSWDVDMGGWEQDVISTMAA